MKILILGLGFISTNLGIEFSLNNYKTFITYRSLHDIKNYLVNELKKFNVELIELPEVKGDRLMKILSNVKPDVIINCIGKISGSFEEMYNAHVKVVNELCKTVLSRFSDTYIVHISTAYVIGKPMKIITEEEPHLNPNIIKPETNYEKTKVEGEKLFMSYVNKGLKGLIIRPVVVYGRYCYHKETNIFFNYVRKGLVIKSSKCFSMINVENLSKALIEIINKIDLFVKEHIILSEHDYTFSEIFETIRSIVKPSKVKVVNIDFLPSFLIKLFVPREVKPYIKYLGCSFRSNKLPKILMLKPMLEDGLRKQYEMYKLIYC